MSEPHSPDLNPQNQDPASTSPNLGSISHDPLLERGSYIDPTRTDSVAESPKNQQPEEPEQPAAGNPEFPPGVVIAAEPISMYLPGEEEDTETPPAPRSGSGSGSARRRNREEMSKRPSWLPEDWTIDLRVRSSGATAGLIDRYYVEPTGQRRFRSKNEVEHFLQTGIKLKRRATSETDAGVAIWKRCKPKREEVERKTQET
ncbi:hypothetical protein ACS0TY_026272 [Phlomoides rotata]